MLYSKKEPVRGQALVSDKDGSEIASPTSSYELVRSSFVRARSSRENSTDSGPTRRISDLSAKGPFFWTGLILSDFRIVRERFQTCPRKGYFPTDSPSESELDPFLQDVLKMSRFSRGPSPFEPFALGGSKGENMYSLTFEPLGRCYFSRRF